MPEPVKLKIQDPVKLKIEEPVKLKMQEPVKLQIEEPEEYISPSITSELSPEELSRLLETPALPELSGLTPLRKKEFAEAVEASKEGPLPEAMLKILGGGAHLLAKTPETVEGIRRIAEMGLEQVLDIPAQAETAVEKLFPYRLPVPRITQPALSEPEVAERLHALNMAALAPALLPYQLVKNLTYERIKSGDWSALENQWEQDPWSVMFGVLGVYGAGKLAKGKVAKILKEREAPKGLIEKVESLEKTTTEPRWEELNEKFREVTGKRPIAPETKEMGTVESELGDVGALHRHGVPKTEVPGIEPAIPPELLKGELPAGLPPAEPPIIPGITKFMEETGKPPEPLTFSEKTAHLAKILPPEELLTQEQLKFIPKKVAAKTPPKAPKFEKTFGEKVEHLGRGGERLPPDMPKEKYFREEYGPIEADPVLDTFAAAKSAGIPDKMLVDFRMKHMRGVKYQFARPKERAAYKKAIARATRAKLKGERPPVPPQIETGKPELPNEQTQRADLSIGFFRMTRNRIRDAGGVKWEKLYDRRQDAIIAETEWMKRESGLLEDAAKSLKGKTARREFGEFLAMSRDWWALAKREGQTIKFDLPSGEKYSYTIPEGAQPLLNYWIENRTRLGQEGNLPAERFVENYFPKIGYDIGAHDTARGLPDIFRPEQPVRGAEPFYLKRAKGKELPPELDAVTVLKTYVRTVAREKFRRPFMDETSLMLKGETRPMFRNFIINEMRQWYGYPGFLDSAINSFARTVFGAGPRGGEAFMGTIGRLEYSSVLSPLAIGTMARNQGSWFAMNIAELGPKQFAHGMLRMISDKLKGVEPIRKRYGLMGEVVHEAAVSPLGKFQEGVDWIGAAYKAQETFLRESTFYGAETIWDKAYKPFKEGKIAESEFYKRIRLKKQDPVFADTLKDYMAENPEKAKRYYMKEINKIVNVAMERGEISPYLRGSTQSALLGMFKSWASNQIDVWYKYARRGDVRAALSYAGAMYGLWYAFNLLGVDITEWFFPKSKIAGKYPIPLPTQSVVGITEATPLVSNIIYPLYDVFFGDEYEAADAARKLRQSPLLLIPMGAGAGKIGRLIEKKIGKEWTPSIQSPLKVRPTKGKRISGADITRSIFGGKLPSAKKTKEAEEAAINLLRQIRVLEPKK